MKTSSRPFSTNILKFHTLGKRMETASLKKLFAATIALVAATSAVSTALAQSTYEPYAINTLAGLAGQTGSADGTGSAARFNLPGYVAVDSAGNAYVGDTNNYTIRKTTSGGVVTTLAGSAGNPGSADGTGSDARFNRPFGVAVDSAGNVYVADEENCTIRKVTSGGVVTTLAGSAGMIGSADGTGSDARFYHPRGVAVDSAGNVYVGDWLNQTIRKVTSGGVVTTLAGLAGMIGSADGTGSNARFFAPYGVAAQAQAKLEHARKLEERQATVRENAWLVYQKAMKAAREILKQPLGNSKPSDAARLLTVADALGRMATDMPVTRAQLTGKGGKALDASLPAPIINVVIRRDAASDEMRKQFGVRPKSRGG